MTPEQKAEELYPISDNTVGYGHVKRQRAAYLQGHNDALLHLPAVTGIQLENDAAEALKEIHQHTTLCVGEHEENIFLMGYNAGVNKNYAKEEQWVSVSERLPEKSGQVLGIMKNTLDQYVCFYKKHHMVFYVYGAGSDPISDMNVTHWQPLPSPPKHHA